MPANDQVTRDQSHTWLGLNKYLDKDLKLNITKKRKKETVAKEMWIKFMLSYTLSSCDMPSPTFWCSGKEYSIPCRIAQSRSDYLFAPIGWSNRNFEKFKSSWSNEPIIIKKKTSSGSAMMYAAETPLQTGRLEHCSYMTQSTWSGTYHLLLLFKSL